MEKSKTKFRPILFSTPMVQAILEGRKTMTRRTKGLEKFNLSPQNWRYDGLDEGCVSHYMEFLDVNGKESERYFQVIPAYEIGDVLWVRETFAEWPKVMFQYKASTAIGSEIGKWKPSIFMPKEACRIFLKVKAIRVERLQDISEEDAKAEGAKHSLKHKEIKLLTGLKKWLIPNPFLMHQFGFLAIWCTINGCDNWEHNPFVFVYEFEQIEKPLNFIV